MVSSTLENVTPSSLLRLAPVSFDDALRLYALRSTDRAGWERRNQIENIYWLVDTLSKRLRDEENFTRELTCMAQARAEDLHRRADEIY